jgi:hypothetical protein
LVRRCVCIPRRPGPRNSIRIKIIDRIAHFAGLDVLLIIPTAVGQRWRKYKPARNCRTQTSKVSLNAMPTINILPGNTVPMYRI